MKSSFTKLFDRRTVFASGFDWLLQRQHLAVSSADNESAGVIVEKQVVVLDREHGSCRGSIRSLPSKATTFFAFREWQERKPMDSHEVYESAIRWFAKRHWPQTVVPQKTVLLFILNIALTKPDVVSGWISDFCKYRDAEAMDPAALLTARLMECREYRPRRITKRKN